MNQLAAWIDNAAAVAPQSIALITGTEEFSFAALAAHRQRNAADHGGSRATAVTSASSRELAFAAYACSFAGVPLLPLNPALSQPRRAALLEQCGAQYTRSSGTPPSPVELIIATSGSEGAPKGVMLSAGNLAASVAASQRVLPLHAGDIWLDCLPLYHVGGMAILWRCAAARATVLLHEGFDAGRAWEDLHTRRVTHISLVPPMLARILDISHGAAPPDSLQYVLCGGGALSGELAGRARASGWPLAVSYGMSEAASQVATLSPLPEDWTPGCAGRPLPGFEVRIRDADTAGVGAVQIRGAALMAGYANPGLVPGDGLDAGWFTSGDCGRLDADGMLHVLGRRDDMLVSGGVNLHPAVVEETLMRFPGLRDAAVTALPDPVWGERVTALVVGEIDLAQLEAWCRAHLAGALRPRRIVRVAVLPRNALGKLERAKLKEMASALNLDTTI